MFPCGNIGRIKVDDSWSCFCPSQCCWPFMDRLINCRWSVTEQALRHHFSVDFQTQSAIGKIFSQSKRACFIFVNRTRNGQMAAVRSLLAHWFRDQSMASAAELPAVHGNSKWLTMNTRIFVLRKKGSKTKERMKEGEIEKGDCGPPTRKVFFWDFVGLEPSGT